MNSKQILPVILVLIMSLTIVTPVLAIDTNCPQRPRLVIDEINDVTMRVGETLERNITASIVFRMPKISTETFFRPPVIRIRGMGMPDGSTLVKDTVGIFRSSSIFTFTPTEPGIYNVTFVARTKLFGRLVDREKVSITVLPKSESDPEPDPDPKPEPKLGGLNGCFGLGAGTVGPIHPNGMYMHALWNMMDFIEEHTDTTRNELEDMTHLQVLELYYEVLVKVESGR